MTTTLSSPNFHHNGSTIFSTSVNSKRKRHDSIPLPKKVRRITDFFQTSSEQLFQYDPSPFEEVQYTSGLNGFPCYYNGEVGEFTIRRSDYGSHLPYFLSNRGDLHLFYLEKIFSEKLHIEFVTPQCFPLSQNRGKKEYIPEDILVRGRRANYALGLQKAGDQCIGMDILPNSSDDKVAIIINADRQLHLTEATTSRCTDVSIEDQLQNYHEPPTYQLSSSNSRSILYYIKNGTPTYHSRMRKPVTTIPLSGRVSESRWMKPECKILVTSFHNGSLKLIDVNHRLSLREVAKINYDILDYDIQDQNIVVCGCRRGGIQQVDLRMPSESNANPSSSVRGTRARQNDSAATGRRRRRLGVTRENQRSISQCKILDEYIVYGGSDDGFLEQWDLRKLYTPIQSADLNAHLSAFDRKFDTEYSHMMDTATPLPNSDPSLNLRNRAFVPPVHAAQGLSSPISGLAIIPTEPNYIAFQMQSGHVGYFDFKSMQLRKFFYKYNMTHATTPLRKTPLCFVPPQITNCDRANFLFCGAQNHLCLLNLSHINNNSILSNIIERTEESHFISQTKSNSFGSQTSLLLNSWDVSHPTVGLQYVQDELWSMNDLGHIFSIRQT